MGLSLRDKSWGIDFLKNNEWLIVVLDEDEVLYVWWWLYWFLFVWDIYVGDLS